MKEMRLNAVCKLDYSNNAAAFWVLIKNKSYKIYGENDEFFWMITYGNKDAPFYLMKFSKKKRHDTFLFTDYFYTIKEERKFKLEKLNGNR